MKRKKCWTRSCEKYGHVFHYCDMLLGGASIDAHGVPLTEETIAQAKACDAVLMGSIGGDAGHLPLVSAGTLQTPGGRTAGDPQGPEPVCQCASGVPVPGTEGRLSP